MHRFTACTPVAMTARPFRAAAALRFGLFAASALAAASAQAAPPDVTRYCQTHLHPGVPTSYSTQDGRTPMFCLNSKGQAGAEGWRGSLTPVDLALACRLTSGSDDFGYVDGFKIECGKNPRPLVARGPGVRILQPADLTKYCVHWYGPGARGQYSATLKRTVCTGGAAPLPATVNFALACNMIYKTNKVRYVDGRDRYFVACQD
jgi:hypothetical protein